MPLQHQIKCKLNMFRFTLCAMFAENMNSTEQNEFLVWHPHSGYRQTLNFPTAQRYVYFLVQILIPLSLQKVCFGTGHFHSTGKDTILECIFNVCLWCQAVVDSNSYNNVICYNIQMRLFWMLFISGFFLFLSVMSSEEPVFTWCFFLIFSSLALPLSHSLLNIHLFTLGQKSSSHPAEMGVGLVTMALIISLKQGQ